MGVTESLSSSAIAPCCDVATQLSDLSSSVQDENILRVASVGNSYSKAECRNVSRKGAFSSTTPWHSLSLIYTIKSC